MPAPIFGPLDGRWSLGSSVVAHWWERKLAPPGGPPAAVERSTHGQVVAITRGGPEGWLVTVSRGPLFGLLGIPSRFGPSQIRVDNSPGGAAGGGGKGCGGI